MVSARKAVCWITNYSRAPFRWFKSRIEANILWLIQNCDLGMPALFDLITDILRDVWKKNRENGGILENRGGGLPESHFHIFTVFNMGDLPKINGKIGKKFPNRGEGVPDLGKIPTFSRVFLQTSLTAPLFDILINHCNVIWYQPQIQEHPTHFSKMVQYQQSIKYRRRWSLRNRESLHSGLKGGG